MGQEARLFGQKPLDGNAGECRTGAIGMCRAQVGIGPKDQGKGAQIGDSACEAVGEVLKLPPQEE